MRGRFIIRAQAATSLCFLFLPAFCAPLALHAGEEFRADDPGALLALAADLNRHQRERELAAELLVSSPQGLPVLLAGLSNERSVVRQVAAKLLGSAGGIACEQELLDVAVGNDFLTAENALNSLSRIYSSLPEQEFLSRLDGNRIPLISPTAPALREAMQLAALRSVAGKRKMSDAVAAQVLVLLTSESEVLREGAVAASAALGCENAAEKLLHILPGENRPRVQKAICQALAALKIPGDFSALLPYATDDDKEIALEALAATFAMGKTAAIIDIANCLENHETKIRVRAARILRDALSPEAIPALVRACEDVSWQVRLEAVKALAQYQTPAISTALQARLSDEYPGVRAEAAVALHATGMVGAVAALLDDLKNNDVNYRYAAAKALRQIRSQQAVGLLDKTLTDADLELVCLSVEALAAIGGEEADKSLQNAAQDDRKPVSFLAKRLLSTRKK
jgi:HEAT repeat protein